MAATAEQRTRAGLERTFTRIDGARVHAVHAGEGPPVVLLHGLSASHHWWRYTIPALAEQYRVHAPELLGFGRSDRPVPSSVEEMMAVVSAWLDALEVESAALIGHSMGGQIAIHLAAAQPARVRRLVLAAPAGIPRQLTVMQLARFMAELVPPRAWGRLGFWPTVALDAARAGPAALMGATRSILRDDVRQVLPRIESRTLVVWGEHDPLVPLEHGQLMARAIPHARLIVFAQAAHNVMVDRPDAFNAAVLSFLSAD